MEQTESRYSMVHKSQFGEGEGWTVWDQETITRLSDHDTKQQARGAIRRYEAADKRRAPQ